MSLIPVIKGGLGNQLFQLATVWSISKSQRRPFKLNPRYILQNKHSATNYFDNLLAYWKPYFSDHDESRIIKEDEFFRPQQDILKQIGTDKKRGAVIDGYFQTAKYIDPYYKEFTGNLRWNTDIVRKYDELATSAFIHVRGGDYLQPQFAKVHHIDMTDYYKRALQHIKDKAVNHFYVFTNDIPYLESKHFFDDIRYTVVPSTESEVDSLYLMSKCGGGGIGVNSSFSWWGLYLDKSRKNLILPDRWFNDTRFVTNGFYFPEVIKVESKNNTVSKSITPKLFAGLGNQLFQLAAGWGMAKTCGYNFNLNQSLISISPHSNINYLNTIFNKFKPYISDLHIYDNVCEDSLFRPHDYISEIKNNNVPNICLYGYYQTAKYIDPHYNEFMNMLSWNNDIINKYDELSESAFIHLRGGDYINSSGHYIDMNNYYKKALNIISESSKPTKHFYIFTNDIPFLESKQYFDDIRYTVIDDSISEIDSLYLMSKCGAGGIAVNSTFSWWGLYLDKYRQHMFMPDKWLNNPNVYMGDFPFNGVTVLSTI